MFILSLLKHRVVFAPEGEGNSGGGTGGDSGGTGGGDDAAGFGNTPPPKDPNDDDLDVLLTGLTEVQTQEEKDQAARDKAAFPTQEQQQADIKALHSQLTSSVENLKLADDLFPDDMDFSNPQQMRDVMTKAVKFAVLQSVGMSMFPMSKALEQNQSALVAQVKQMMAGQMTGNNDSVKLASEFPLINDPRYGTLFKELDARLRESKKPYPERLRALKGLATRMELNPKGGTGNGNTTEPGQTLSGAAALDSLFE